MTQYSLPVIDPTTNTGTELSNWLNSWRPALESCHKGAVRPSYANAGMIWVNDVIPSLWVVNLFDGVHDVPIAKLDPTTGAIINTGGTLTGAVNEAAPVTLPSAATVNIGAAAANSISITGAVTITGFDTVAAGARRLLMFQGSPTLVNSAALVLPSGSNIIVSPGDTAEFVSLGSGNWRCIDYSKASGAALVSPGRNKIINGKMEIAQRGNTAVPVVNGSYAYPCDRFFAFTNTNQTFTVQQVNATAGTEFVKSTRLVFSGSSGGVATHDVNFSQIIEGFNISGLAYGTPLARPAVFSFKIRSSVTGVFSVGFTSGTRSYATTYTVDAANTWESKQIFLPGDTGGTWDSSTGTGLICRWDCGGGSNFRVTANNTWATRAGVYPNADSIYGCLAVGASTFAQAGATVEITGAQFEPGTVATPFEHRQYGQELALCQRYYYDPLANSAASNQAFASAWQATSNTAYHAFVKLPVSMRVAPTLSVVASNFSIGYPGASAISSMTISAATNSDVVLTGAVAAMPYQSGAVYRPGTSGGVQFSAEL